MTLMISGRILLQQKIAKSTSHRVCTTVGILCNLIELHSSSVLLACVQAVTSLRNYAHVHCLAALKSQNTEKSSTQARKKHKKPDAKRNAVEASTGDVKNAGEAHPNLSNAPVHGTAEPLELAYASDDGKRKTRHSQR